MSDLRFDALALVHQLSGAEREGASEEALSRLVIDGGWRRLTTPADDVELIEGVLRDGRHVPVQIRSRGRAA